MACLCEGVIKEVEKEGCSIKEIGRLKTNLGLIGFASSSLNLTLNEDKEATLNWDICFNGYVENMKEKSVKIKYCPFCGHKLV